MTMVIELSDELKRQLDEEAAREGKTPEALTLTAVEQMLAESQEDRRRREAVALLDEWLNEPPDEEDASWSEFQQALEADHSGPRRLFSE